MPIFEYKCNTCGTTKDKLVSRAAADEGITFQCEDELPEECTGTLARSDVPSAAALRFKGQWFGTTGRY